MEPETGRKLIKVSHQGQGPMNYSKNIRAVWQYQESRARRILKLPLAQAHTTLREKGSEKDLVAQKSVLAYGQRWNTHSSQAQELITCRETRTGNSRTQRKRDQKTIRQAIQDQDSTTFQQRCRACLIMTFRFRSWERVGLLINTNE